MNVYQKVTERIIEQMRQGIIPWNKPWRGDSSAAINYVTRRPYSLINQMLLGDAGEYMSFRQATEAGGTIKRGAKGRMVVFYKRLSVSRQTEDEETGEVTESSRVIPLLRYYYVFHIDDIEGVESRIETHPVEVPDPDAEAERIVMDYVWENKPLKLSVRKSDRAYYSPALDEVVVPQIGQYQSAAEYYSTMFHELVHSTGAGSRLNRDMSGGFGSEKYSREELVAEMGAAMLLGQIGLETEGTFRNSVAYLQSWIEALRNDDKMIVWAASRAEKAVKYINGEKELQTNNN